MKLIKMCLASFFVFIFNLIVMFAWFVLLNWHKADNFLAGILFWILCVMCVMCSLAIVQLVSLELPYKFTIICLNAFYYIAEIIVVSVGIFAIPRNIYILLQLIMLFFYAVVSVPIMLMSRPKEGEI